MERTHFPLVNPFKFKVTGSDGYAIDLQTYEYPASDETKAVIFFINGYGTYGLDFGYLFKDFAEQGFSIYTVDRRGFGLSGGKKGEIGDGVIDD